MKTDHDPIQAKIIADPEFRKIAKMVFENCVSPAREEIGVELGRVYYELIHARQEYVNLHKLGEAVANNAEALLDQRKKSNIIKNLILLIIGLWVGYYLR